MTDPLPQIPFLDVKEVQDAVEYRGDQYTRRRDKNESREKCVSRSEHFGRI